MIFSGPVNSPFVAQGLARLIELLSLHNPAAQMVAEIRPTIPDVPIAAVTPETPLKPAWAVVLSQFKLWIVIDGCGNVEHAVQTALGYPGSRFRPDTTGRPEHDYLNSIAADIVAHVTQIPGAEGHDIIITGHSLGGAVAQVVALRLRELGVFPDRITVITFGAPRWGNRYQIEALRTVRKVRWMSDQDPVPLMWPRVAEWPGQLISWAFHQLARAACFGQGEGGMVLDAVGRLNSALYPDVSNPGFGPALGYWLWSWYQPEAPNFHKLRVYQDRLDRACDRFTFAAQIPRVNEQRDLGGEENARAFAPAAREAMQVFREQERVREQQPVIIPPARRISTHHIGGVWTVEWQGQVVATATRRRTAQSLARALNASIEHIMRQGEVDPVALGQQMQQFLRDAADSHSGITPTLTPPFGPAAPTPPG